MCRWSMHVTVILSIDCVYHGQRSGDFARIVKMPAGSPPWGWSLNTFATYLLLSFCVETELLRGTLPAWRVSWPHIWYDCPVLPRWNAEYSYQYVALFVNGCFWLFLFPFVSISRCRASSRCYCVRLYSYPWFPGVSVASVAWVWLVCSGTTLFRESTYAPILLKLAVSMPSSCMFVCSGY